MSDRWRRSLLGYSVPQFERARAERIARHRMETTRLEAELERMRGESLELRDRLTDLEKALQAAEQRNARQSRIHAVPPPTQGWLHLRRGEEADAAGAPADGEPTPEA